MLHQAKIEHFIEILLRNNVLHLILPLFWVFSVSWCVLNRMTLHYITEKINYSQFMHVTLLKEYFVFKIPLFK